MHYKHTINDYDIQAYVDNELNHEEAKQVQIYINGHAHAHKRYQELTEQRNLLKMWWANKAKD